ncbi:hypothetical protein Hanom_Chr01g00064361 [Helianthus anomalus]
MNQCWTLHLNLNVVQCQRLSLTIKGKESHHFYLTQSITKPLLFLTHLILHSTIHTPTTNLKPTSPATGAP